MISHVAGCAAQGVMEGVPAGRGYSGGFAAELMVKDLGLALAAAQECSAPAPVAERMAQLYQRVVDEDQALDFSALYRVVYGGAASSGAPGSEGEGGSAGNP